MLTQAELDDEVRFWLNQDREHNLFYALGFQREDLRSEAMRLHDAYAEAQARDDLGAGLAILDHAQAYKLAAKARLDAGEWLGWIWPSFIQHTHDELAHMRAKVAAGGAASPREETCLIDRFQLEHLAFAAHLLDPGERHLDRVVTAAAIPALDAANRCAADTYETLRALSLRSAARIDQLFSAVVVAKKPPPASIIHPALGAHVVREGRRWLGTLQALPPVA